MSGVTLVRSRQRLAGTRTPSGNDAGSDQGGGLLQCFDGFQNVFHVAASDVAARGNI